MTGDHFSSAAAAYASFRPRYPDDLFAYLAARAPRRALAWDCATGSGQAALGLARHFTRVIATDASTAQLAHAAPHPQVEYRVAAAEASGLEAASVDLVAAAQALHWFDIPAFFAEARRVLVARGVVAVWCYNLCQVTPAVDRIVRHFYAETLGPYWPSERRLVETEYRSVAFPFAEVRVLPFQLEHPLTLAAFGGYLRTWSATLRYAKARSCDPVGPLLEELRASWGGPAATQRVRWPLALRVGRKDDPARPS